MNVEQAIDTCDGQSLTFGRRACFTPACSVLSPVAKIDADSDLDILIDLDPAARLTIFDYVGLKEFIASLFDSPVDVVDREGLKPYLRQPVSRDLVNVF